MTAKQPPPKDSSHNSDSEEEEYHWFFEPLMKFFAPDWAVELYPLMSKSKKAREALFFLNKTETARAYFLAHYYRKGQMTVDYILQCAENYEKVTAGGYSGQYTRKLPGCSSTKTKKIKRK